VDVRAIGCDFYAFSGHKVYGPSATGALYGREALLAAMPPWQGGGDMIASVSFEKSTWNELPYKFEAGTPNIAGTIGLGAAADYLSAVGMDWVARHDEELIAYGMKRLHEQPGLRLLGPQDPKRHAGVLSFWLDFAHPHDIAQVMDTEAVCVRAGHHCAMPVNERFGVPATTRASVYLYNTQADLEAMVGAIEKVRRLFSR